MEKEPGNQAETLDKGLTMNPAVVKRTSLNTYGMSPILNYDQFKKKWKNELDKAFHFPRSNKTNPLRGMAINRPGEYDNEVMDSSVDNVKNNPVQVRGCYNILLHLRTLMLKVMKF